MASSTSFQAGHSMHALELTVEGEATKRKASCYYSSRISRLKSSFIVLSVLGYNLLHTLTPNLAPPAPHEIQSRNPQQNAPFLRAPTSPFIGMSEPAGSRRETSLLGNSSGSKAFLKPLALGMTFRRLEDEKRTGIEAPWTLERILEEARAKEANLSLRGTRDGERALGAPNSALSQIYRHPPSRPDATLEGDLKRGRKEKRDSTETKNLRRHFARGFLTEWATCDRCKRTYQPRDREFKPHLYVGRFNVSFTLCKNCQPLQCLKCKYTSGIWANMCKHVLIHTEIRPYKCNFCEKTFVEKVNKIRHTRTHTREARYNCPICKRPFIQKAAMLRHYNYHKNIRPHTCPLCNRTYITADAAATHLNTHTRNNVYTCNVCHREFTLKSSYMRHMRMHQAVKNYSCAVCKKDFKEYKLLKHHFARVYHKVQLARMKRRAEKRQAMTTETTTNDTVR